MMTVVLTTPAVNAAHAAIVPFTDAGTFFTQIEGRPTTIVNFESADDGTKILPNTVFENIAFDLNNDVTGDLEIINGLTGGDNAYPRFSPFSVNNYLGSDVPPGTISESFQFSFQAPVNAVGLYILSASQLNAGEIALRMVTGASESDRIVLLNPDRDSGGGELLLTSAGVDTYGYFLGFADSNPFLSLPSLTFAVEIRSPFGDLIGIDDIAYATAVPEPGTVLFLSVVTAGIGYRVRRRNRLSAGSDRSVAKHS